MAGRGARYLHDKRGPKPERGLQLAGVINPSLRLWGGEKLFPYLGHICWAVTELCVDRRFKFVENATDQNRAVAVGP